jgi:hypothetical protein
MFELELKYATYQLVLTLLFSLPSFLFFDRLLSSLRSFVREIQIGWGKVRTSPPFSAAAKRRRRFIASSAFITSSLSG